MVYLDIKNLMNQNMILSSEEMELLNEKGFKYIPREYFGQELTLKEQNIKRAEVIKQIIKD